MRSWRWWIFATFRLENPPRKSLAEIAESGHEIDVNNEEVGAQTVTWVAGGGTATKIDTYTQLQQM